GTAQRENSPETVVLAQREILRPFKVCAHALVKRRRFLPGVPVSPCRPDGIAQRVRSFTETPRLVSEQYAPDFACEDAHDLRAAGRLVGENDDGCFEAGGWTVGIARLGARSRTRAGKQHADFLPRRDANSGADIVVNLFRVASKPLDVCREITVIRMDQEVIRLGEQRPMTPSWCDVRWQGWDGDGGHWPRRRQGQPRGQGIRRGRRAGLRA